MDKKLRLKISLSKFAHLEIVRAETQMHSGWIPKGVHWCTRLRSLTLTKNSYQGTKSEIYVPSDEIPHSAVLLEI